MSEQQTGFSFVLSEFKNNEDWRVKENVKKLTKDIMIMIMLLDLSKSDLEMTGISVHEHINDLLSCFYEIDEGIENRVMEIKKDQSEYHILKECIKFILSDKYEIPRENQANFNKFINVLECIKDGADEFELSVGSFIISEKKDEANNIFTSFRRDIDMDFL